MNNYLANSLTDYQINSNNGRSGVQIDKLNSNPYIDTLSQNFYTQYFIMPTGLNPHENGIQGRTGKAQITY